MASSIDSAVIEKQSKDYMLHLIAVRKYFQRVLKKKMPSLTDFEGSLCNGVYLATLACKLSEPPCSESEVFDPDQKLYNAAGLQYQHIENINVFLTFLNKINLANVFYPDVADIYEKKNLPKLIYCLYALKDHHKEPPPLPRKTHSPTKPSDVYFISVCVFNEDVAGLRSALQQSTNELLNTAIDENVPRYYAELKKIMNEGPTFEILRYDDVLGVVRAVNEDVRAEHAAAMQVQKELESVIKIQAHFRGFLTRKELREFKTNPTFSSVKRFSSILQYSLVCYKKEQQLQLLKSEIFQLIEYRKALKATLEEKDLQIGLLIQNRLSVQQIFLQRKKKLEKSTFADEVLKKQLDPRSQLQLLQFQNLFHALQTNPNYFATMLVHCCSQDKGVIQSFVMSSFNYGSTAREEQLLLKVFEIAVSWEVDLRFNNLQSLDKSSSPVINSLMTYCKHGLRLEQLKEVFGKAADALSQERNVILLLPLDIYNSSQSNASKKLTNNSDAYNLPWVREHLLKNISKLQKYITTLIYDLLANVDKIPDGIKRVAHMIFASLRNKFNVSSVELLKVVGSFIFYRLFNPLISVPDAPRIVEKHVISPQRKNHALIGKMLGYIVLSKGFAEDYLQPLNGFITDSHKLVMNFMVELVGNVSLEGQHKSVIYSEIDLLTESQVTVTLEMLSELLSSLKECVDKLDAKDSQELREMLDSIGVYKNSESLLNSRLFQALKIRDAQQRFRISCVGKDRILIGDADTSKLFLGTKELCVFLLPFLVGRTLPQALLLAPSRRQCITFEEHVRNLPEQFHESQIEKLKAGVSLSQAQRRLKNSLEKLESMGYVSKDDGYQTVLQAISQDIILRRKFLQIQIQELQQAVEVKSIISKQIAEMDQQLSVYDEYLNSCLRNQAAKTEVFQKVLKNNRTVKYTAQSLLEKGVLVSISNMSATYYNQIVFSITPEGTPGVFAIKGKWNNMQIETVLVDIRNLLHLQYEGCETMNMFQNVTLNVSGLILLINRKFYGS